MAVVKEIYPDLAKPAVAVDLVILRVENVDTVGLNGSLACCPQVILLNGENGKLTLPGSMMRLGETAENVIDRVLTEKLGLSVEDKRYCEQLYTVDDTPERDDRGHVVSIVYLCALRDEAFDKLKQGIQWYWVTKSSDGKILKNVRETKENSTCTPITKDNASELVYYDHYTIICDTLNRIKGKLKYTDIGFNFVAEKFTLTHLQNVFEALCSCGIPAFRRMIKNKVEATNTLYDSGRRPSMIYTRKKR